MSSELNVGKNYEEAKEKVVFWHNKWAEEKLHKEFIIEYLNPVETKFRDMMNNFSKLSSEQKDKIINLAKALKDCSEEKDQTK